MNNLAIALKITNYPFSHDFITNLLELTPTETHYKDEPYWSGPPDKQTPKTYKKNYWEYRIFIQYNEAWIKNVIDAFSNEVIIQKEQALDTIKDQCNMELYIGVHFKTGENLDSYHFDIPLLATLARLKIEIDIDQFVFDNLGY